MSCRLRVAAIEWREGHSGQKPQGSRAALSANSLLPDALRCRIVGLCEKPTNRWKDGRDDRRTNETYRGVFVFVRHVRLQHAGRMFANIVRHVRHVRLMLSATTRAVPRRLTVFQAMSASEPRLKAVCLARGSSDALIPML